jgi:hypothetical protein
MTRCVLPLAALVIVAATSGCGLCLLPCYLCLPTGSPTAGGDPARALPEIQPALLAADEAAEAQFPTR